MAMIINFDRGNGQTPEQMSQSLMESVQMALDTMERKLSAAGINISGDGGNTSLLDTVYPVGSIYLSVNETSPEKLFGGKWEQINGRFLVGQGNNGQSGNNALDLSAGATGGETSHTLSLTEIPSHNHGEKSLTGAFRPLQWGTQSTATSGIVSNGSASIDRESIGSGSTLGSRTFNINATHTHNSNGGGGSHNNLPPYLAVYMWKRTA